VYRVRFPRTDLHVSVNGVAVNFQEAADGVVATTGDFVLTAEEVTP
jgi:hypothetical protein